MNRTFCTPEDRKAGGYRSSAHEGEEDHKFEVLVLKERDKEYQAPLANVLKSRGVFVRYVYPCDALGRVTGDRLPSNAPFDGGAERFLVVGQYCQERFFSVRKE